MKIIFASSNKGKFEEVKEFFKDLPFEFVLMGQDLKIEEKGSSFKENALIKAEKVFSLTHIPTLGEDSGLCVDFLDSAPGLFSKRFKKSEDCAQNRMAILIALKGVPFPYRKAHFISVFALKTKNNIFFSEGKVQGFITDEEIGKGGFGYDPIFLYPYLGRTFAEMSVSMKNRVSHRGKALSGLKKILLSLYESNNF